MDLNIGTATANDLTHALKTGEISSRELLDELLSRADRVNPALNAIVAWDIDRARLAAAAADEATAKGEATGPLHGLPMTVKDVWETEGLVTTSGAPALADHVPQQDAIAVARLKEAGAIIFGKSNTPMYAGDWQTYNEIYGRTSNPWDVSRTTGGSSGGAAAAVAAGLTPLELGSDIGGSIRIPAHYNGVYGLKPSWGIVPLRGHIPGPPGSLVEVDVGVGGPIARSVADLRTALEVMAGPLPENSAWRLHLDAGAELNDVSQLRVGTLFDEGSDVVPIAGDVRASLDRFASRLADAGARVQATRLPVPLIDGFRVWRDITLPVIGLGFPQDEYAAMAELAKSAGDDPMIEVARAATSSYLSWMRATELRQHQRVAWAEFFGQFDVVLAPVMPTVAFPHDTDRPLAERLIDVDGVGVPHFAAAAWCGAIGAALLPVVTLPTGLSPAGLPVGVQVAGPFLSDLRLLRAAELLESAAEVTFMPPPAD
jgi:amidase